MDSKTLPSLLQDDSDSETNTLLSRSSSTAESDSILSKSHPKTGATLFFSSSLLKFLSGYSLLVSSGVILFRALSCAPDISDEDNKSDPGYDLLPPSIYSDFQNRLHSPDGLPLFQAVMRLSEGGVVGGSTLLRKVWELYSTHAASTTWKTLAFAPLPQRPYLVFCLERYLLELLYPRVYPNTEEDLEQDVELYNQLGKLATFITPKHLDLPEDFPQESFLGPAREELCRLSTPKSPLEKLQCLVRCCKFLLAGLKQARQGQPLGADDFVPALIYLLLQVNPPALSSNLKYIQRFVSPWWDGSEAQYYLVALEGAVQYLLSLEASSLSLTPDDFASHMEFAEKTYEPIQFVASRKPEETVNTPLMST